MASGQEEQLTLEMLGREYGFTVVAKRGGFLVLESPVRKVVYLPMKGLMYVGGSPSGVKVKDHKHLVDAVTSPPEVKPKKEQNRRKRSYVADRKRLWDKDPHCFWCNKFLLFEETTLDHIVPLCRGGGEEEDNHAIACNDCNQRRGSSLSAPNPVERIEDEDSLKKKIALMSRRLDQVTLSIKKEQDRKKLEKMRENKSAIKMELDTLRGHYARIRNIASLERDLLFQQGFQAKAKELLPEAVYMQIESMVKIPN